MSIAKGKIPDDIEEIKILENQINICELLLKVGFANSKSEAKRMIIGNGVKVDGIIITNVNKKIEIEKEVVVQFGKNRFKKVTR